MVRKVLEWQIALLLLIGIVVGGKLAYDKLREGPAAPAQIGTNAAGKLTSVMNVVVAEQKQTFARFVDFKAEGAMKVLSLGLGKAKLYFQWEAKNSYGIRINERQPVEWRRTPNAGEIEVIVPALELLESKIYLEPDKYVVLDVQNSVFVNEEKKKYQYHSEQVRQTTEAAEAVLAEPQLSEIARAVIGDHVKNLLNQGLTTDKIHTAKVSFRPPARVSTGSNP